LILFPGTLIGISYAGAQIGIVTVMPLAGLLCNLDFDGGWPLVFYTVGLAGILWSILWLIFAASSPQTHRTITEPERKYILQSLDKTKASKTYSILESQHGKYFRKLHRRKIKYDC
jgi:MFS family permease